jgi:cystathionine beta-lyase/cystathionine gamma-synthase
MGEEPSLDSILAHGAGPDSETGALARPVEASVVGAFRGLKPGDEAPLQYSRGGTPSRSQLESLLAALEGGGEAFTFASGMAAINCFFQTVPKGSHVILGSQLYGRTRVLADEHLSKFLEISYADPNDTEGLKALVKDNTKYVFLETMTNPLLRVADLTALQEFSFETGIPYVIDNTFAPYLVRGFDYGAEAVIYSLTKYIGGHNDVLGGAVVTQNVELADKLRRTSETLGAVLGSGETTLTIRSLQTLPVRMERHCSNALKVARFLKNRVSRVYYPGLPGEDTYQVARKQFRHGFGGVVSFEIEGDYQKFAEAIAWQEPAIIHITKSLGGTASMLSYPATMSHANLSLQERNDLGIPDNLFRLSVGLEDYKDIIRGLKTGLEAAKG